MKPRVLIVDDEASIRELLAQTIKSIDMTIEMAIDGRDALGKIMNNQYELILLDINLPFVSGYEILEQMRKNHNLTPVIIVSDRKEDFDTVYGLGLGADAFVTKPFNPITLAARIKALLRRNGIIQETKLLEVGPFEYDTETLRLYKNGEEIILTSRENSLVKLFLDNPGRIFSKDVLYEMVWSDDIVDDNTIMVYINRLRSKLEDDAAHPRYIQTVRRIGYRFIV